jgi:hypothetical protein
MRGRALVVVVLLIAAACGARTGLLVPEDASVGVDHDVADVHEAGVHDVVHDVTTIDDGGSLGFDAAILGDAGTLTCAQAANQKLAAGCDYVVPTPSFYTGIAPPCFALFVANDGIDPVQISVDRDGVSYDPTTIGRIAETNVNPASWPLIPSSGLPPGEVAVLFASEDPSSNNNGSLACPVTPAISQKYGTALTGAGTMAQLTGRGKAWHVATTRPVLMYDILPFGGATSYLPSAELLLPTSSWDTNYFGFVPPRGTSGPQWGQVVAAESGTTVVVYPNTALPSGTNVIAAPANVQTTFTLGTGEYIQWQESNEMSGTIFQSNKPIGFFGGHTYSCYYDSTSTGGGCDSAHQEMPPIRALGSTYAVAPYTTRRADGQPESIRYRFVGVVPGTKLSYTPAVSTAPVAIGEGQVSDFETSSPFVVSSQDAAHPFYVAQVMTGCQVTGGSWDPPCLGDEEHVNVIPPAQYVDHYVFFTDLTYASTNLVITRARGSNGFSEVTLDCLGAPLGNWTSIDVAGNYEFTNVWLKKSGTPQNGCDNGPHYAKSDGHFSITVWGLDQAASYAYPAGASVAQINSVVVAPVAH